MPSMYVMPMPPDGQIIDGFSCTLFLKGSDESAAREAGLAVLQADQTVRAMKRETSAAEVERWQIECETVTRLGFWRHLLPLPKRVFVSHWVDEQKPKVTT